MTVQELRGLHLADIRVSEMCEKHFPSFPVVDANGICTGELVVHWDIPHDWTFLAFKLGKIIVAVESDGGEGVYPGEYPDCASLNCDARLTDDECCNGPPGMSVLCEKCAAARLTELKAKLLELARSGAPKPRHNSPDPEEQELARVLDAFTTPD